MPRNFSAALKAHLAQPSTTLTTCWQITRRDGTVHRYTALDADLTIGADVFSSIGAPYSATSYSGNTDLSVDNLDIDWLFGDISRQDILAGLLDDAEVRFWLVNWQDPDASGKMLRGWTGELTVTDDGIKGELRGMLQRLQQRTGLIVSPGCRYDLGDARCGIDLEALAVESTTTEVGFTTDFADDSLGTPPVGWTQRYSTVNATFEVAADATAPSGKTVNINTPSGASSTPHILTLDGFSAADCEVLALVRPHVRYYDPIHIIVRGSGETGSETYYCAALYYTNMIRIGRLNAGVSNTIASASFNYSENTRYWIRFRAVGTSLKFKMWLYGAAEPGAWNVETTNSSITAAGWTGFGNKNTLSRDGDVAWFGVSTNGETVPVPGTESNYSDRFYDTARTEATGYFNGGLVTFLDGDNAGLGMEVKDYNQSSNLITLYEPLFYAIAPGAAYRITPGCDKVFATCRDTYDNALVFGGEPHLPGYDVVLQRKQGGVV
jgi:uncharacterized phage protein (TIGR02218 family)